MTIILYDIILLRLEKTIIDESVDVKSITV